MQSNSFALAKKIPGTLFGRRTALGNESAKTLPVTHLFAVVVQLAE
jgi:hypothetical protein